VFEISVAAVMLLVFVAVWVWQNPGWVRGRLRPEEIAQFMARVETLPFPGAAQAEVLRRLRTWLEGDDGKPFYMLNLMRYYAELRRFPGAPDFEGTPRESNARYEAAAKWMLLRIGGYPAFAGTPHGRNLLEHDPALDDWDRVILVRYPSRRAFMKLLTHPAYPAIEPYKLMALTVVLTPSATEVVVPGVPLVVGGALLVVFLAFGWARAAGLF
jgi:hypothetical protein